MADYEELFALSEEPFRRTDDRKLIAVFPMWFPVEMLIAAGLRASEWWGFPLSSTLADSHYPAFICSLVKSNFEVLLNGQADPDGMVFTNPTCDSIQNSAGLFRHQYPGKFNAYFRLTQNPESEAAADYLRDELSQLRTKIGEYAGNEISDDDLAQAIKTANAFRQAARNLLSVLKKGKTSIPAAKVYQALRGALADIGPRTTGMLNELSESISVESFTGPRFLLLGMTPEPLDALTVIEQAGGMIAGDDLGLGWRTMSVDISEDKDPIEAMAQRYLNLPPCSSLHFQSKRRGEHVLERAKDVGADAVLFTRLKFCDPEAFDYPDIKCLLDDADIPSLLVEREFTDKAEGTITTRLEAFLEQIR